MKILVPIDGSVASHRAVEHAVWLTAGRPDARVILVNVQNRDTLGISDIDVEITSEAEIAMRRSDKLLHAAVAVCEKAGVPYATHAAFGPIVETILRIAGETHADQIVMGSRGLGRLRGALLGSVATQLIHAADIPVTVVKKGMRLPAHASKAETCGKED